MKFIQVANEELRCYGVMLLKISMKISLSGLQLININII